MSSIDINYKVQGLDPLTEAIESLISVFSNVGNNIQNTKKDENIDHQTSYTDHPMNKPTDDKLTSSIDKFSNMQNQFINKLDNLTSILDKLNTNVDKDNNSKQNKNKNEPSNFDKIFNKTLFTIGTSSMYAAGNMGSIIGSATGAINTTDYTSFMKNQYNKKVNTEQSALTTGISIATAFGASSAAKLGIGGKIAAVGITALGALGLYETNKHTQENIALNENVVNKDLGAWRLANTGISPYSNSNISSNNSLLYKAQKVNVTQLQKSNLGNIFDPSLEDVIFSSRRDIVNKMSTDEKKSYNNQINLLSRLTGNSNLQQLSSVASGMSSITGQNPLESIKNMTNDYVKFGGDTAGNTAKMLQIMQSTPMGEYQARELANKYQYNEPMMQNKIAQSTATIPNKLQHYLAMKIGGATEEESRSGQWSSKHISQYKNMQQSNLPENMLTPFTLGYELSNSIYGTNRFATEKGTIDPFSGNVGNMNNTSIMNDMAREVSDSIKKLNITEQTVNVTGDIYINGNKISSSSPKNISNRNMQLGLPRTGNGNQDLDVPPIIKR